MHSEKNMEKKQNGWQFAQWRTWVCLYTVIPIELWILCSFVVLLYSEFCMLFSSLYEKKNVPEKVHWHFTLYLSAFSCIHYFFRFPPTRSANFYHFFFYFYSLLIEISIVIVSGLIWKIMWWSSFFYARFRILSLTLYYSLICSLLWLLTAILCVSINKTQTRPYTKYTKQTITTTQKLNLKL